MKHTTRRVAVLATVAALAFALVGPASSSTSKVTLADVSGSRTLTVTDSTGTSLDAATVSTGAGASMPFVANVTDALYDNLAYDVDASLSNLYLVDDQDPSGFDCGVYIRSSALGVSWPAEAFGVDGIEALVTDVLFDVSGVLPSSGSSTLDGILASAGVPVGSNVAGADLSRAGQGLTEATVNAVTLASSIVTADMPLSISVGTAMEFTAAADHSVCAGGAVDATDVNLQRGEPNGAFSLVDVATAVEGALVDAAGVVSGGHLTGDEILDGIFTDAQLTEIQTAVASRGLGSTWDAYVDTIVAALALDDVTVSSLVGQTGSYTSVPSLDVDPELDVTGTAPAGMVNRYEGEMVITLSSS